MSEYLPDHYAARSWFSGFNGSAGTLAVTSEKAALWADGRYFIQAAAQLEGTGVELFKMGEPGVPTVHEFLEEKLGDGMCLGFDGRTVNAKEAVELKKILGKKGAFLSVDYDLIGEVWENRPALSY